MKRLYLFTLAMMMSISSFAQNASKDWGVQLYTLRTMIGTPDLYRKNHERVFESLRNFGFTQAELYGYEDGKIFGIPAQEFVDDVRKVGITPVSSHVQYALTDEEVRTGDFSGKEAWWRNCIAQHKAIGVNTIVYVWYAFPKSMLELQRIAEYLDWIGNICKKEGIRFGYHNHDHELRKVEGKEVMLDYLLSHTNPENVFIEMDVYWTVFGHGSPVDYFKRYPGRFKILHIKDQYEIGQSGMVGFDAIFRNVHLSGAEHMIVEQETTEKKDMLESLKISMDYLLKMKYAQDKLVALSFDDGPNTVTTVHMLDVLKKHGVKASFFVIGKNINEESAKVMQRAYNEGHDIENHSLTHCAMPTLTADSIRSEISQTSALIEKYIGEKPQFFRPPYIALNRTMFDSIDLPFISGEGCTDWEDSVTADMRLERMLGFARDGLIFLLHDMEGNEQTVEAVDRIIPILKERGYRFVTVRTLFKEKNIATQRGIIYTDILNAQPWKE